jgi:hypothetical protein
MRRLEEWIDLLEGESGVRQSSKLGLLLKHSKPDQEVYANLTRLRRIVKKCDPAYALEAVLHDEKFMMDMHKRTMQSLTAHLKQQELSSNRTVSCDEGLSHAQEFCKT